ncbi:MAG: hypothetical protein RB292_03350 [Patescibacteria group bacterium]|nr:hypothetical protein [Patescibacteria group bacterium]
MKNTDDGDKSLDFYSLLEEGMFAEGQQWPWFECPDLRFRHQLNQKTLRSIPQTADYSN